MHEPYFVLVRSHVVMIIIIAYQLYLAVSSEAVEGALKDIERVGTWPIQVLNVGLFVLVLGICWLYLQSTRKDLLKLQSSYEAERKEYVESLKALVGDMGKIIERNNIIYERIDRRLDRIESASSAGVIRVERPAGEGRVSGTGRAPKASS